MAAPQAKRKFVFLPEQEVALSHIGAIAIVGALVGIATWLLSMLISSAVIEPLFCRSTETFSVCNNGGNISFSIAAVAAHIAGLFALVRTGTYRPLLVVLASVVTLWGLQVWLGNLAWFEATLFYAFVVAVSYALYAWLARIVSFGMSLAVILVVIILSRVFLNML